jgi:hypothetical protein
MAAQSSSLGYVGVVGADGQLFLGEQFAGRQVIVEEQEPGVWLLRAATVVPDNERWLQQPAAAHDLRRALDWALAHPASDENTEALLEHWNGER